MRSLVVFTHPDKDALTGRIAREVAAGSRQAGNTADVVDLSAESFDPRFTLEDIGTSQHGGTLGKEVRREQDRLDQADALVLVFPVYWWAMPALLKGWIDRVFSNGWAFEADAEGGVVGKLEHLDIYLVAIGGADLRTYEKHGYWAAMKAQIEQGIFAYCGARSVTLELLLPDNQTRGTAHLRRAHAIGASLGHLQDA
ncbi:MAG: NAD(P)H-dependent oxidoreductase [Alphaproteobacteria bacterium]|nr:NAD(P)H-dependent oxidoreductase [Alphaproteobacteria bacterium]